MKSPQGPWAQSIHDKSLAFLFPPDTHMHTPGMGISEHSPGASSHGRCTQQEHSLSLDPDQDTNLSSGSSATEHQTRGSHIRERNKSVKSGETSIPLRQALLPKSTLLSVNPEYYRNQQVPTNTKKPTVLALHKGAEGRAASSEG